MKENHFKPAYARKSISWLSKARRRLHSQTATAGAGRSWTTSLRNLGVSAAQDSLLPHLCSSSVLCAGFIRSHCSLASSKDGKCTSWQFSLVSAKGLDSSGTYQLFPGDWNSSSTRSSKDRGLGLGPGDVGVPQEKRRCQANGVTDVRSIKYHFQSVFFYPLQRAVWIAYIEALSTFSLRYGAMVNGVHICSIRA